jgi:hypothetical protein
MQSQKEKHLKMRRSKKRENLNKNKIRKRDQQMAVTTAQNKEKMKWRRIDLIIRVQAIIMTTNKAKKTRFLKICITNHNHYNAM